MRPACDGVRPAGARREAHGFQSISAEKWGRQRGTSLAVAARMSAFGGVLHFDGRPVDRQWLAAFGIALARRGPDEGAEVVIGPVGLAHRACHTTRDSRFERQPVCDRKGAWLCWDGRLDNGGELEPLVGSVHGPRTDAHLVLASYRSWGTAFLPHIVGDFALALWDASERRLFLARDCVGTRTLYFHCDSERAIWSTDLEALLRFGDVPLDVDEEFVAGFLAYEAEPSRSPFRNVHAVRPAEVVSLSAGGRCDRRPFWTLNLEREVRRSTDDESAEEFLDLFREAVRVRLRTDRPVVAELSGGLDSSSIVVVADSLIVAADGAPRVETVSQVFEEARSSDERRFIGELERHRGRPGRHFSETDYPLFSCIDAPSADILLNPYAFAEAYHRGVDAFVREIGARVLLSGVGGDEVLDSRQNPSPELGDLLVRGQLLQLLHRGREWSEALHEPFLKTLYRYSVEPALPAALRRMIRARRFASELSLYRPEYIARTGLRERLGTGLDPIAAGMPSARDQAAGFVTVTSQIATGFRRRVCSADVTYPYLHRPLVEFLQAIPFSQRAAPGGTRIVQRAALRGVLPESILHRRSKGNPMECFARAFTRTAPALDALLSSGVVVQRGYVDRHQIAAELLRLKLGCSKAVIPVLKVVSLEIWLRALESRGRQLRGSPEDACASGIDASGARGRRSPAANERDATCATA